VTTPQFARPGGPLEPFLRSAGGRPGDERFTARNFLLDENVSAPRTTGYESAIRDLAQWNRDHETYLDRVACWNAAPFPPKLVDPRVPGVPETFHQTLGDVGSIATRTWLVRVTRASRIARDANLPLADVRRAISRPADLDRVLKLAGQRPGQAPSFATFWNDVADLLPEDESAAASSWPDRLRDRLGLSHMRPRTSAGEEILVFRYPAARVPRVHTGAVRAFTIPTVLDMSRLPAFCPVPERSDFGRVVDLVPGPAHPRREVLHPPIRLRQEDLFRRGILNEQPPALDEARGAHLKHLRDQYKRPDYADATDAELIP
jgi:hypothetical protein